MWRIAGGGSLPPREHGTDGGATSQAAALSPLRNEDGSPIVGAGFVRGLRTVAEAVFATEPAHRRPNAWSGWRWSWRISSHTPARRRGSRYGSPLLALALLAPLMVLRFTSLRRMAIEERVRAIGRLEHSSLGAPVLAIKALLCVLYYEHPDAAPRSASTGSAWWRDREVRIMGDVIHASEVEGDLDLEADVVVVGSGAGGAVVACELAEAGQDVIVLEEGGHVPPERYGRMRPSETMRHMWRDAGLTFAVGVGDTPMVNVMMGRCVGGSSVLTGGVCFRIPGSILHEWSTELGLDELTEKGMEPCFEAVEKAVHVEEVPAHMRSKSTLRFLEGAERLGYPTKPLRRNTHGCNGCGRCNFGCPHGAKLSVDVTYLPRAIAAGARVYSDCRVDAITQNGGRASGVVGRVLSGPRGKKRGQLRVRARRVVLAAGAYGSPLLLEQRDRAALGPGGQEPHAAPGLPRDGALRRTDRRLEGLVAERVQRRVRRRTHHAGRPVRAARRARRDHAGRRAGARAARGVDPAPRHFRRHDPRRRRRLDPRGVRQARSSATACRSATARPCRS